jgi:hypothetical protein
VPLWAIVVIILYVVIGVLYFVPLFNLSLYLLDRISSSPDRSLTSDEESGLLIIALLMGLLMASVWPFFMAIRTLVHQNESKKSVRAPGEQ